MLGQKKIKIKKGAHKASVTELIGTLLNCTFYIILFIIIIVIIIIIITAKMS